MLARLAALGFLCLFAAALARANESWSVTILGNADDARVPAIREAVRFWNEQLESLGLPACLGPIEIGANSIPDDELAAWSRAVDAGRGVRGIGRWIEPVAGRFVVVLSGADLMSFAMPSHDGDSGVLVLRRADVAPLSVPNVARNVAAHELGHLLGLPHNSDPDTLMCGRPAPCRPDTFASASPRFFPLTPDDVALLRARFPTARSG